MGIGELMDRIQDCRREALETFGWPGAQRAILLLGPELMDVLMDGMSMHHPCALMRHPERNGGRLSKLGGMYVLESAVDGPETLRWVMPDHGLSFEWRARVCLN